MRSARNCVITPMMFCGGCTGQNISERRKGEPPNPRACEGLATSDLWRSLSIARTAMNRCQRCVKSAHIASATYQPGWYTPWLQRSASHTSHHSHHRFSRQDNHPHISTSIMRPSLNSARESRQWLRVADFAPAWPQRCRSAVA